MTVSAVFLRRARIRALKEGVVQTARTEATENDAKDAIERFQDYGFAGNPVDGQGLVLTIDGVAVVLRIDRLAKRPNLAPLEVSVWHDEGHNITLKGGKVVETNCDTYIVNAAVKAQFNTPVVAMSAKATVGDTLAIVNGLTGGGNATFATGRITAAGATVAGKVIENHNHNETGGITGPNN